MVITSAECRGISPKVPYSHKDTMVKHQLVSRLAAVDCSFASYQEERHRAALAVNISICLSIRHSPDNLGSGVGAVAQNTSMD